MKFIRFWGKLNIHYYKEYGGISYWVGDGFCDDINNNEACDYDDGDCCGLAKKKNFCIKCICKGKSNSSKLIKGIESILISSRPSESS